MSQPNWIGHTLHGRYKIESLLGSGGMATVYKAFDPNLGRYVAVKLIHPHLAQQPEFVKRFKHEAAAVAKLHHPYIVPVYDFNDDQGVYYMVLAYLTGKSLEKRLEVLQKVGRHLPLSEAIDFMVKICEAVDYAHQQQIIHRDIKPGNVLFDQNGQPYLTDFGIARLVGNQQTMTVAGTPTYMSPEQIRGDQQLDQRSDIYSLGIMLYEMVSGKPPFEGGFGTLMLKHMQEAVPDLRILNSNIPETLVAVIEKALAKDPADRFQSVAEMANALRNKRQPTDPTIVVDSPPDPAPSQKRPIWVWTAVVILALVIGAAAFLGGGSGESETVSPETTSEPVVSDEVSIVPVSEVATGESATGSCPDGTELITNENFCLHTHEVSNGAYRECVAAGACSEPERSRSITHKAYYGNAEFDEYPVVWVNWEQAVAYCKFDDKRLPTAAEWDEAAQKLTGLSVEQITKFDDAQAVKSSSEDVTSEGVYDLAGNVREWVEDADGIRKTVKGQSFLSTLDESTLFLSEITDSAIGFRCAADLR